MNSDLDELANLFNSKGIPELVALCEKREGDLKKMTKNQKAVSRFRVS